MEFQRLHHKQLQQRRNSVKKQIAALKKALVPAVKKPKVDKPSSVSVPSVPNTTVPAFMAGAMNHRAFHEAPTEAIGHKFGADDGEEEVLQAIMEEDGAVVVDVVYDQSILGQYLVTHSQFELDVEFEVDTHDIIDPTPPSQVLFDNPSEGGFLPAITNCIRFRTGTYTPPIGIYSNPTGAVTIPAINQMSINTTSLPELIIKANNML